MRFILRFRVQIVAAVIPLLLTACTKYVEVPRHQFEVASHDAAGSHRIRAQDGNEYVAHSFSLTDSTLTISRLSPADPRYQYARLPLVFPLNEVTSVARVESSQAVPIIVVSTTFAMILLLNAWYHGWGGLN